MKDANHRGADRQWERCRSRRPRRVASGRAASPVDQPAHGAGRFARRQTGRGRITEPPSAPEPVGASLRGAVDVPVVLGRLCSFLSYLVPASTEPSLLPTSITCDRRQSPSNHGTFTNHVHIEAYIGHGTSLLLVAQTGTPGLPDLTVCRRASHTGAAGPCRRTACACDCADRRRDVGDLGAPRHQLPR